MSETSKRKRRGRVRRAADTALDVAIGGPVVAAEMTGEALDKVVEQAEEALQTGRKALRRSPRKVAKPAQAALRGKDARPYEERTRAELYELAAERGIGGRSSMRKADLIAALRR